MSKVRLDIRGAIAVVTLENESKLNAFTGDMLEALDAHTRVIESDHRVRAVVLTGTGTRAFCAGADIREWGALGPRAFARDWVRRGHRIFDGFARLSAVTIGALNGHAFGGGLELAACCDLRVMVPGATIALPETGVGIVPGWSGTQRVVRLLPPAVVKEMAFGGRRVSAERALALGFVNEVAEDALGAALTWADEIATRAPQATETAKWMIAAALGEDAAAGIEAIAGAATAAGPEKAEGVAAFADKRKPDFGGEQ